MHMRTIAVLAAFLLLSACNTPMKTDDIQNVQATCTNVDDEIATLQKEKEENNRRIKAGITAILPVSAVIHIVRGNYSNNVKLATGEWAEVLDAKLAELYNLKAKCPQ